MTDDMVSRDALRELLFDGVAPPTGTDAMFDRTFAEQGPYGAELLPPDGLFDLPADDPADDPALDEGAFEDLPSDDAAFDDPGLDVDGALGDEPGADHGAGDPEHGGATEYGGDPHDGTGPDPLDPGTGW